MAGRDPAEAHRAATPLELLFDLCFVAIVAMGLLVGVLVTFNVVAMQRESAAPPRRRATA
jgi:low temperature requirement protein LtrA